MKAAIYVRMSTDKEEQEASPDRQRETVGQLCQREGYQIVREYFDDGISGTTAEKRPQFQQMIADAVAGQFKVIVADSSSRISRMNEWAFVRIADRLREADITIHTVADGKLNWDDDFAFFQVGMKSMESNRFSKAISHNVTSGSLRKAQDGRHMGGVPYGYRLPDGSTRLEIHEPEAAIVRWIFHAYDNEQLSLGSICKKLNAQGTPSPGSASPGRPGTRWHTGTVRRILTNERYIGTQFYGKTPRGKFNYIKDRKQEVRKRGQKPQKNATYFTKPGAHDPIVDKDLFDRVQPRLIENRKHYKLPGAGGHVYSGMVVCGGCGKNMVPKKRKVRENGKETGEVRLYWACENRTGTCATPSFAEDRINLLVGEAIQSGVFNDQAYERHIAELTRKIEETSVQVDPERIKKLESEIRAASKNILFLPEHIKADALEGINERKAELDKLQAQLRNVIDVRKLFEATRRDLEQRMQKFRIYGREPELKDIEEAAGKARLRQALRSWLKKVTIFWKRTPPRKYQLLAIECETQWEDVQRWPPDVAMLYRHVLTKPRQTACRFNFCQPPLLTHVCQKMLSGLRFPVRRA